MHRVAWLLLILISSAWFACEVDVQAPAIESLPRETTWRRTARGWEKNPGWAPPVKPYEPAIHPAIVATAQLFVGLFFLAALPVAIPIAPSTEGEAETSPVAAPKWLGLRRSHDGALQSLEESAV